MNSYVIFPLRFSFSRRREANSNQTLVAGSLVAASDLNVSCPGRVPGFVVFTPANGEEKVFPQSALVSLNKLDRDYL